MAIIAVPAILSFTNVASFKLQRSSNLLASKFTGQAQVVVYPYAVWMLEATLREYDGTDAGKIRSFFAKLEGRKNTFRLPVPGYSKPSTGFVGNGDTFGAVAARATSFTLDAHAASQNILNEGDYFVIQDELKIMTSAMASDINGRGVVNFMPPMRKAAANATIVTLQNPWVLLRAADDDVANWGIGPPTRQQSDFKAVEAVEI